jgi:hypothetical protein
MSLKTPAEASPESLASVAGRVTAAGANATVDSPTSPSDRRAPDLGRDLPVRRPMARVERITLFEREVREKLSRAALELLLARLEVLSEGQRTHRNGRDLYFGSTMMTADLTRLTDVVRDNPDEPTAVRLVKLLEGDETARARLLAIAVNEANRIACVPLVRVETHLAIRADVHRVYADVDVEAEF